MPSKVADLRCSCAFFFVSPFYPERDTVLLEYLFEVARVNVCQFHPTLFLERMFLFIFKTHSNYQEQLSGSVISLRMKQISCTSKVNIFFKGISNEHNKSKFHLYHIFATAA